ncbi:uncharacterized protein TM35_000181800 [Trypanosoma theileri]|uniref:Uncharacterized protein n=1 Tax=Trypanosoma theileri TaxID=67003 RepID=A0A1X0NUG4_9TRYP|nr:uncharacterized protein TM35_000181800 [Trypanosoma theileri]ORC88123.1 hypothetical protein TM35_000181800 [Trypanosoma theileri]
MLRTPHWKKTERQRRVNKLKTHLATPTPGVGESIPQPSSAQTPLGTLAGSTESSRKTLTHHAAGVDSTTTPPPSKHKSDTITEHHSQTTNSQPHIVAPLAIRSDRPLLCPTGYLAHKQMANARSHMRMHHHP